MRLLRWSCSSIADGLYALSLQRPSSLITRCGYATVFIVGGLIVGRASEGSRRNLPGPAESNRQDRTVLVLQAYDVTMSAILVALMAYSAALWSAANEQGVSSMGSLLRDVCVSEASMGPLIAVSMPL